MKKMMMVVLSGLLLGVVASAQEKAPVPPKPTPQFTPLKVQVVLMRYNGDRKVSSMPYTMAVNATPCCARNSPVSVRMGVQVPLPSTVIGQGSAPVSSFQYRNVGMNIDCWASLTEDGRFNVNLGVEQSSIYTDDTAKRAMPTVADQPILRSFNSSFAVLLKDGETTQYVTATDPVSGEVMKIDVTVNVVK